MRFHTGRAGHQIGLSFVGNVAILESARANPGTAVLRADRDATRFAAVCRGIRRAGSAAGVQLAVSPTDLHPARGWRAPNLSTEVERLSNIVQQMSAPELASTLERFVDVAEVAATIGFDVIQIHAAHGYLLSLLLDSTINRRTDHFGLNTNWIEAFVRDLRAVIGKAHLSFRINAFSGITERRDESVDAIALAQRLSAAGVDILDFSAGHYTVDRRAIYPAERGVYPMYRVAAAVAATVSGPVIFSGGVTDLRVLPKLASNMLVGIGRGLIADPSMAEKTRQQAYNTINWCQRTNRCHYFSRGESGISCGVNEDI
jgi:2,4-dienoyl-CoA reductase-like NADH-dependent reductase (Old Yellow Enzyme family)